MVTYFIMPVAASFAEDMDGPKARGDIRGWFLHINKQNNNKPAKCRSLSGFRPGALSSVSVMGLGKLRGSGSSEPLPASGGEWH